MVAAGTTRAGRRADGHKCRTPALCWKSADDDVKFHPRGRGGGAGRWIICWGKDKQRDGATVLQEAEEVQGAYRPRPTQKVHIRRPVLCRKGFTARAA